VRPPARETAMSIFRPQRLGVLVPVLTPIALLTSGSSKHHVPPTVTGGAPAPLTVLRGIVPTASRIVVARQHPRRSGIELRAVVRGPGARIVAVTFFDGSDPLGTDTTAPYRLDILPSDLSSDSTAVHAVAVDRFGRRSSSRSVLVRRSGFGLVVSATPRSGLPRALDALRRGGATVRLGPGRYAVDPLRLGTNTRLIGAGPETVVVPRAGVEAWALLSTNGRHIRVQDLVVAGDRRVGRAISVGSGSVDVRLQGLWLRGARENGVEVWGRHRDVSVQDSVIDGHGATNAGVTDKGSDASSDVSVVRSRIFGFRGYGVLFAQRFYARPTAALHNVALDNYISDIIDPTRADGTDEGGIWSGGVGAAIIGNHINHTGIDGIETVGSSTRTAIIANHIAHAPVGIYLEHSTNASLIARNDISHVGTGINVEWRHAGGGSSANTFAGNAIVHAAQAGLFVDVGSQANRIEGNHFVAGARPAIVLQGASVNLVRRNLGCGADGRLIRQQTGRWEDGSLAEPRRNRLVGNVERGFCVR
jgi:parallel beta helix pectate lyase-like protein